MPLDLTLQGAKALPFQCMNCEHTSSVLLTSPLHLGYFEEWMVLSLVIQLYFIFINFFFILQIVQRAKTAFQSGKTKPYEFRYKQLKQLLRLYEENVSDISEVLANDLRKVCICIFTLRPQGSSPFRISGSSIWSESIMLFFLQE